MEDKNEEHCYCCVDGKCLGGIANAIIRELSGLEAFIPCFAETTARAFGKPISEVIASCNLRVSSPAQVKTAVQYIESTKDTRERHRNYLFSKGTVFYDSAVK